MNPNQICFACMRELPTEGIVCPYCGHDNRLRGNGPGFLKSTVLGGQYFVGKVLGRGGFGITYLGLDLILNRKVAIKEYYPEGVVQRDPETLRVIPFGGSMDQTFREGVRRAVKEARTAALMEDIPNTVRIYSVLEANGTVYIVMKFIDGITLTALVQKSGGKLPWVQAWPIIDPVLDTLSRVHLGGIVHRDVSPDNIMIRFSDSSPVLLDFGTARSFTTGNTEHSTALRLGFSPMEMYTSNGAIDQRSDEYAVMATLYYMLTGKKPESPLNVAAGIGKIELPSELGSDIPTGVGSAEEVLMRGLEFRMDQRYPTIDALRQAFRRALEQGATMVVPSEEEKQTEGKSETAPDKIEVKPNNEEKQIIDSAVDKKEDPGRNGALSIREKEKRSGRSKRKITVAVAAAAFVLISVGIVMWLLNPSAQRYTVTWKNEDGTVLELDKEVSSDSMPEYNGITPTKPDDDQFSYTFEDWTPIIKPVQDNEVYVAVFEKEEKKNKASTEQAENEPSSGSSADKPTETRVPTFTITWLVGTESETTTVPFGEMPTHDNPAKEPDDQYIYEFVRWTPELQDATADTTYEAVFKKEIRSYVITWQDEAGNTIDTTTVAYGTEPMHEDPVKEQDQQHVYVFTGWQPTVEKVKGDATYKAAFRKETRYYTITWLDDNGKLIDTSKVRYGSIPWHKEMENKADEKNEIRFKWDPDIERVKENATYKAVYERIPWESVYRYNISNQKAAITEYLGKGGKVTIPQELGGAPVKEITAKLFKDNSTITSVVISEGIERICDEAFSGNDLQEIYIPSTLRMIGDNAFWAHDRLKEIHLDSKNESFTLVEGVLFSKDKNVLYLYPSFHPMQTSYSIPEGVIRIKSAAFSDAVFIKNISFPNSLESIESFAFWGCGGLKEIRIPEGVNNMGFCCFGYLSANAKIYIPATVKTIDNDAFYGCKDRITIEGEKGSYAEKYASRNGIKFVATETESVEASDDNRADTAEFKKVGSIVKFGCYEQDNKTENGPEEMEWIVLDYDEKKHKSLLLSRYGLDALPYDEKNAGSTWKECTLRTWLNDSFLNSAFTAEERKAIRLTNVDNSSSQGYGGWNTSGGINTQDMVFLLSYAEANMYLGVTYGTGGNTKSCAAPTAYAIYKGAHISTEKATDGRYAGWWWLRSPGYVQYYAALVSSGGSLICNDVANREAVVRPALWINLGSE